MNIIIMDIVVVSMNTTKGTIMNTITMRREARVCCGRLA